MADDTHEQLRTVEILRLIEETRKFTAEQHKLTAEATKFRVERWLLPITIIAGGLGTQESGAERPRCRL
jgi:hypothetical protein